MMAVITGLDVVLTERPLFLLGKRVGLLTNSSGVSQRPEQLLRSNTLALRDVGIELVALFSPEHGLAGAVADAEPVAAGHEARTGLPVHSLYGDNLKPTAEMLRGIDVLLYDIQDVGVRFYTYTATLGYALEACAQHRVPLVVLDRPNPIGGERIEGPVLDPALQSFIGHGPLPLRFGLTLGELAGFYNGELGLGAELKVIPMRGWRRDLWFEDTGLLWVPTSPSMPHPSTTIVYPGMCLVEGTNLSEGRGTPLPFECAGAPWIDGLALAEELNGLRLEGVRFRPMTFTPSFWKFSNEGCQGVQLHVTDRDALYPVTIGLELIAALRRMYPAQFAWNARHFDRLMGDGNVRGQIDAGVPFQQMVAGWKADEERFRVRRERYLLY
jgi:uncharacterized protein YbbC (DUF1343 family)